MRREKTRLVAIGLALLGSLVIAGCSDDDGAVTEPDVVISGDHAVEAMATLQLSASTVNGEDASYTWMSDDESVATVDASGTVTGVAAGETYITATGSDTAVTGMHAVVVTNPAGGLPVVSVSGPLYVLVGSTAMFTAMTVNGTDSGYTFESSDEAVATVDATGNVMGISVGEATITATGADSMASGSVQVAVSVTIPNEDAWADSGHADVGAEAFRHWDEDGEVSASCARCHSTAGYRDYLGADGSAQFSVEQPAPIDGGGIECQACHNPAADMLSTVIFPSGVQVDDLGPEARCMTCHQGRASTDSVNDAIATNNGTDTPDLVAAGLGFVNIHYYAAGATLNAGKVRGGYQYEDKTYDWRFRHVPGYNTCVGCHDPHSLEVKVSECQSCHTGVQTVDDFKNIRMMSSEGNDYDGDGDTGESLHSEMEGLRTKLMSAMQAYTAEMGNSDICYDSHSYPYFFIDTDGNGTCETGEANYGNKYAEWSPRLLRAAYNYQVSLKDPGAHAHNAKYMIQLMFDSIEDINTVLTTAIDIVDARREDHGHFNGAGDAARHWDTHESVDTGCSKCHGGSDGFRFFLQYGVGQQDLEQANGLDCATCHDNFGTTNDVVAVDSVTFPGDVTVSGLGVSGLCSTCHSGRESGATIDAKIAANEFGFRNVHYLPAGAIRLGAQSAIGYQYPTKSYSGAWNTHSGGNDCVSCHSATNTEHTFQVADNMSACSGCHSGATVPSDIRMPLHSQDYDNDGNSTEPLADEISTLAAAVLAQIRVVHPTVCYEGHSYPYWFIDSGASVNGICDAADANYGNQYASWDAALMKAAHNYQISQKDPGAWAHNFDYMAQLLIDSIEDLGGNVAGYIRPAP